MLSVAVSCLGVSPCWYKFPGLRCIPSCASLELIRINTFDSFLGLPSDFLHLLVQATAGSALILLCLPFTSCARLQLVALILAWHLFLMLPSGIRHYMGCELILLWGFVQFLRLRINSNGL